MVSVLEETSREVIKSNSAHYSVIIIDAVRTPKIYSIDKSYVTVGRKGNGQDIELESRIVSHEHGAFKIYNEKLLYSDFQTNLNGTFLNGVKLIQMIFRDLTVKVF